MEKRKIALKDIAIMTGLSVNTVSRALRNKEDISEATTQCVKNVAKELGYLHNALASSLRQTETKTIAVIVSDISNPYFSWHVSEIEKHAQAQGYITYMFNTQENEENELHAIHCALQHRVDGIILTPAQRSSENVEFLLKYDVPFVLMGRYFVDLQTPCAVWDDRMGGYTAVRKLLELGHRKIFIVHGPQHVSSARERLQGSLDALTEFGITQEPDMIREITTSERECDQMERLAESLVSGQIDCTGMVVYNDMNAIRLWNYLEKRGKKVPEDYSIVSFDNVQFYLGEPFRLTSIGGADSIATQSVDMLIKIIRHRIDPHNSVQATKVVGIKVFEGISCGPAPSKNG